MVLVQLVAVVAAGRQQPKLAVLVVAVVVQACRLERREPQAKETLAVPRQVTEDQVAVEQAKQARLPPQGWAPRVVMDFQIQ